jgi:hypothetical protein
MNWCCHKPGKEAAAAAATTTTACASESAAHCKHMSSMRSTDTEQMREQLFGLLLTFPVDPPT